MHALPNKRIIPAERLTHIPQQPPRQQVTKHAELDLQSHKLTEVQ